MKKPTNNLIVNVIKNVSSKSLLHFARKYILPACYVYIDFWKGYRNFKSFFLEHKVVNHIDGYVSKNGVNTNQIESVWKHLRRTFKTHIRISKQNMGLYTKEAEYIYNKNPNFETVMLCLI